VGLAVRAYITDDRIVVLIEGNDDSIARLTFEAIAIDFNKVTDFHLELRHESYKVPSEKAGCKHHSDVCWFKVGVWFFVIHL
jgi:hypothetical protein